MHSLMVVFTFSVFDLQIFCEKSVWHFDVTWLNSQEPTRRVCWLFLYTIRKVKDSCDDTINWIHSYLTDQAFLVGIDNEYSSTSKISYDVSQQSILGSLLFSYTSVIRNKLCYHICYYTPRTMKECLENQWLKTLQRKSLG